jgi:phage tail protein X
MSSRYKHTVIRKNREGKRVFKPTLYPKIPIRDSDVFMYPKYGDRLDNLAYKYYGDVSLWWIIAKANNLDAAHIGLESDKQIRIPTEIQPILAKLKESSY